MNFPHVKGQRSGETVSVRVEMAPGQEALMRLPREAVGKWHLTRIMVDGGGRVRFHLPSMSRTVRLTHDLPERLGLDISIKTLRTLIYAGFIDASRVAPYCTVIDLESLMRHIEATRGDNARGFWTAERVARYSEAYQAMHHEGVIPRGPHARPAAAAGENDGPERPEQFMLFPDLDETETETETE